MHYQKAIFLGGTVVAAAAMVIFAQEPVRRRALSRVEDQATLQEQRMHQLIHAASHDSSATHSPKPIQAISPFSTDETTAATVVAAPAAPAFFEESPEEPDTASTIPDFGSLGTNELGSEPGPSKIESLPPGPSATTESPLAAETDTQTAPVLDRAAVDDTPDLIAPADELELPNADVVESDLTQIEQTLQGSKIEHAEYVETADPQPDVQQVFHVSETLDAELGTGPQSPALNVTWNAPTAVNVNEEARCGLVVRNEGQSSTIDTVVQVAFRGKVRVVGSDPIPEQGGENLVWTLGTLKPGEERHIELALVPAASVELIPAAKVTSATIAYGRIRVEEPQLKLALSAKESTVVGDAYTYSVEVSNPGTGPATGVVVETSLPEGLAHPEGGTLRYPIGTLLPGETRSVQVVAAAASAGEYTIQARASTTPASASSAGPGLQTEAQQLVRIVQPVLNVAVSGPKLRYLDRKATYAIRVTNPGTMPATNVRLMQSIPTGFQFVSATGGATHNGAARATEWFLGELTPGATAEVEVTLLATELGEQVVEVTAQAERGLQAEAQSTTLVEGIADLVLNVVDVDDPIEVGSQTIYEIRVYNQGSKAATNVQVAVEVPEGMEPLEATGPTKFQTQKRQILFTPIPRLGARADAVYRVTVKGTRAGDLRFRAWLNGDDLSAPVVKEASTRVYGD